MKSLQRLFGVALVALAAATCAACGPAPPSPEEQVLTNFFRASRLRDTTVLARVAAVVFEPRADGVVQEFEITGSDQEQPLDGGKAVAKHVTIRAQVRTPGGQLEARTIVVTMERPAAPARSDRWFITGLTPPPASQISP